MQNEQNNDASQLKTGVGSKDRKYSEKEEKKSLLNLYMNRETGDMFEQ